MKKNEQNDTEQLLKEIKRLNRKVEQLELEKKQLHSELYNTLIDNTINYATAMVMAKNFGCDYETYKKKVTGMK